MKDEFVLQNTCNSPVACEDHENTLFGDHFGKEHIQDQLHTNQNILHLKVLYRALDHPDRKIAESIHIRSRAPALNIQGSSWPIMQVV